MRNIWIFWEIRVYFEYDSCAPGQKSWQRLLRIGGTMTNRQKKMGKNTAEAVGKSNRKISKVKRWKDCNRSFLPVWGEEGLKLHEMMKEHTTFRVGGAADYFIQPKSAEELRAAFEILHRYEMPVLVIGNGSNLLVRDKGIRGAVIQIYNRMAEITIEGNTIHTKGGALLSAVAARAADKRSDRSGICKRDSRQHRRCSCDECRRVWR